MHSKYTRAMHSQPPAQSLGVLASYKGVFKDGGGQVGVLKRCPRDDCVFEHHALEVGLVKDDAVNHGVCHIGATKIGRDRVCLWRVWMRCDVYSGMWLLCGDGASTNHWFRAMFYYHVLVVSVERAAGVCLKQACNTKNYHAKTTPHKVPKPFTQTHLGKHRLLQVGPLKVCVHQQRSSQGFAAEVSLGKLALSKVELLVADGVGLADGVADVGALAAIWVCGQDGEVSRRGTCGVETYPCRWVATEQPRVLRWSQKATTLRL